jgi:hypothetical protein
MEKHPVRVNQPNPSRNGTAQNPRVARAHFLRPPETAHPTMIDLSKRLLAYAVDTVLTLLSLYCVGLAVWSDPLAAVLAAYFLLLLVIWQLFIHQNPRAKH